MDKRIIKTKQAIQDSLLKLLETKDFTQITVTDISQLADINRKTFYYHYQSPYDVLVEFEQGFAQELSQKLTEKSSITDFISLLNEQMYRHQTFFSSMVQKNTSFFFLEQCEAILYQFLLEHFDKKEDVTDKSFEQAMQFVAAGIISLYIKWLQKKDKSSLEKLSQNIEHILMQFLNLYTT